MSVPSFNIQEVQCAHPGGLHYMRYFEWGPTDDDGPALPGKTLICVHGLTRNARDFDKLARFLSQHHGYRVICPDIVGRGWSDRLNNSQAYSVPQYVSDMMVLIARLGIRQVQWVGTSMGGLVGMGLACLNFSPITRLVLNDVGPHLTTEAISRLGEYLTEFPVFADLGEAERYLRKVHAGFGPLSDEDWKHLTKYGVQKREDGRWELRYDPEIVAPFFQSYTEGIIDSGLVPDIDLWSLYERIRCPTLVLRGKESRLLSEETLKKMTECGPRAQTIEFPGVGHAPMLMNDEQIFAVRDFLLADEATAGNDWQAIWKTLAVK